MLTALLLATALCPIAAQEAPAEPAAAADPAARVRTFLLEAEARLYDPQAAGLNSLAFDMPLDFPGIGVVGTIRVSWARGGDPQVTTTRNAGLELPIPPAMLDDAGSQMGGQLLTAMLNRPITSMLDGSTARMDGAVDGLLRVSLENAEAGAQGITELSMYFDEDGLLRKRVMASESGPLGSIKNRQVETLEWKPAHEGSDKLVLASQTADVEAMGMKLATTMSFVYRSVDDIVLPTSITVNTETPSGPMTQNLAAQNLVVNGTPVPGTIPEPAPTTTPPAGASDDEG